MKIYKYLLLLTIVISVFTSCKKTYETENLSKITYFPTFNFVGDDVLIIEKGVAYTDPGCTATENGTTLTVTTSVVGLMTGYTGSTVNVDVPDQYVITYTATNSDGYEATRERVVWVSENSDLVSSIAGIYTSTVIRGTTPNPQYYDMQYILITTKSSNTYDISCAIGGYYYIGRNYGYNYAAQGCVITANNISTNDFSFTQGVIPGFGNTIDMSNMVVDPVNKTISFVGTGNFANSVFNVTLTQVEF